MSTTETEQAHLHTLHLLSVDQLNPDELFTIFEETDRMREALHTSGQARELAGRHLGKSVCTLFYEPSTRTRLSFERAAVATGATVISTENAREFSSAAKGETIEDTVRVLGEYCFSALVLRHHETGAAIRAAAVSNIPIINAGDGKGEHPTQAILDAYTIYERFGRLDNLNITLGGDLKRGRTARSLVKLLAQFEGNRFVFVSRPELAMEPDITDRLESTGSAYANTTSKKRGFGNADVIYWTRDQKERAEDLAIPDESPDPAYVIEKTDLTDIPPTAIIMHPLPRVGEIAVEVDEDPRAVYFKQAGNGLYTRAALLDRVLRASE
jgi:aspartate carbamoyltransferase catalytic subunit